MIALFFCVLAEAKDIYPWPSIYGKAGSYDVETAQEMEDLSSLGFHLHIIKMSWDAQRPIWQGLLKAKAQYIDGVPWAYVQRGCGLPNKENQCRMSADRENSILAQLKIYFEKNADNPNVVGYWILDDYPGADIRRFLEKIHALINEQNRTAKMARPTVCGIGGTLDLITDNRPADVRYEHIKRALTNFSVSACDVVALYPYAVGPRSTSPDEVDWSKRRLLPYIFKELKARGWNINKNPLIGMPQAFYYAPKPRQTAPHVAPRPSDIAQEFSSFCEAGASAIIFYSWHDSHGDWYEGHNTPEVRKGLVEGLKRCRSIWARSSH
jgi:hypothetical protein